jgi:hypothetical protein
LNRWAQTRWEPLFEYIPIGHDFTVLIRVVLDDFCRNVDYLKRSRTNIIKKGRTLKHSSNLFGLGTSCHKLAYMKAFAVAVYIAS